MSTITGLLGLFFGVVVMATFAALAFWLMALLFNAGRRLRNQRVDMMEASGRFARVIFFIAAGLTGLVVLFGSLGRI